MRLEAAVFVCGASTMVLELAGSRLLAPYLGSSIVVWTALIGIVLAGLSIGYWQGGRIADRYASRRVLAWIILAPAAWIAMLAFASDFLVVAVQAVIPSLRPASVVVSIVLFGPPTILLGMVLPYAVKLRVHGLSETGAVVGRLSALSTVGSIVGTFLTGFFLFSYFSHTGVLALVAVALAAAAILAAGGPPRPAMLACALLISGAVSQASAFAAVLMGPGFIDKSTPYHRVWVFDGERDGRRYRVMQINDSFDSAVFLDGGGGFALKYAEYFRLAEHFRPDPRRALVVGGGGYTFPKDLLARLPEARIDVVEIDPATTELARTHFGLPDDARLRIIHDDARAYLNRTTEKYDVIYVDAFKSYSIPWQLTTVEAVSRMHAALEEGGVLAMNVIASAEGSKGRFLRAEMATLKKVFPHVLLYAVNDPEDGERLQNFIVIAVKSQVRPPLFSRDPAYAKLLYSLWMKPVSEDVPPLTDRFAPVDRYVSDFVKELKPGDSPIRARLRKWFSPKKLERA